VSSFNFNNFCNTEQIENTVCGSFFFNDYYTGNIFYFFGAALMVIPLMFFEKQNPTVTFSKKDLIILTINAAIYSLAIFAYAAFDRVHIGFVYSLVVMTISIWMFLQIKKNYNRFPFISYTMLAYSLGAMLSIYQRFFTS
jgi:hypothetical protein